MAVQDGYGKVSGSEALVFAYDLKDALNSYLGEPTTNIISNPDFSNGTTDWTSNQNTTLSVVTIGGTRFLKVLCNQTLSTPGFRSIDMPVSGNTQYTITLRAYKNDNASFFLFANGNGTGGANIVWTGSPYGPNPVTNELTTITRTFTTPADMTSIWIGGLWSSNRTTTSEVYVEYMQMEAKSHATPFVNGTRSSSLFDLVGGIPIDLSNLSFDNDGQPTWDGTNDYINFDAGVLPNVGTDDFAVELIFKRLKTSSYHHFYQVGGQYNFALKMYNVDGRIYVYRDSSLSTYNSILCNAPSTNEYYHLVCQRNGDNIEMYLNGVYQGYKGGWGGIDISTATNYARIGNYAGEYSQGEQPITKLYNRALTSTEVSSNYLKYKNRFGLS